MDDSTLVVRDAKFESGHGTLFDVYCSSVGAVTAEFGSFNRILTRDEVLDSL